MTWPILTTKLYAPPLRPHAVRRPELVARLQQGKNGKLTLISAAAGFGKTTLISDWLANGAGEVAWLSLDAGDSDPTRFLLYLVAALQTVSPNLGKGVLSALQSPQPPPMYSLLTALINEVASLPQPVTLVLDDYHVVDSEPVDDALRFLLEHTPPTLHLLIATREDPRLPLAQLRARGQLTELRARDLRFSAADTAQFLNQAMGLNLSSADVSALEARTEGWIAGLQLAALSMQRYQDNAEFIRSFTGSHHFVLDYLLEEVLNQQPEPVQRFLLHTSVLERLCGPLCEAVLGQEWSGGQDTLETLEHANLFIVPLDDERRWYRYHHLFAELLRQRLQNHLRTTESGTVAEPTLAQLHLRASQWYEDNDLDLEAFHHAVAAQDISHAMYLIESRGMPLQFRGGAVPIMRWLATLPKTVLNEHPMLWVTWGSALLMVGQVVGVAEKAQAAEKALYANGATIEPETPAGDLVGRIASIRATVAVTQHQVAEIINQSRRALTYLNVDNLPVRASITWTLGYAYHLQGDLAAASQTYTDAIAQCLAVGHRLIAMMATIGLGHVQEAQNLLPLAAKTFSRALELAGDPPPPPLCDAYHGLAKIQYEWNHLDAARDYSERGLALARLIENTDRAVVSELVSAQITLAEGDVTGAAAQIAATAEAARQQRFTLQYPEVTAAEVRIALRQGNLTAAAEKVEAHPHPLSQARVLLARGDAGAAVTVLDALYQEVCAQRLPQERLKVLLVLAMGHQATGDRKKALTLLKEALAQAEPSGCLRLFLDEGEAMARLLADLKASGHRSDYTERLLTAFAAEGLYQAPTSSGGSGTAQPLIEPMTERELEVLRLIAQGLSNQEISAKLFRALSTIKGHNRTIFAKLQVQRRTEAIARARELGLL